MFSVKSNEAKIEIIDSVSNITKLKFITNRKIYTIILKKIYYGIYIVYYPQSDYIPQHEYLIEHNMIAFHFCKMGIMNIRQNNQNIEMNSEYTCIHKIYKNCPIEVDNQNYLGVSIFIQIDNIHKYSYEILDGFPPNLWNFIKSPSTYFFISLHIYPELEYTSSCLFQDNVLASHNPYLRIKVLEIILYIDNILEVDSLNHQKKSNNYQEIIREVKDFLVLNYNQDINIDQLSKKYGISNTSLKELFKKTYGKPIISYLRDIRLTNSLVFLEDESLSISEISQMVGYTNQSKFASTFKKRFLTTPHEYRNYIKKIKSQNNQ